MKKFTIKQLEFSEIENDGVVTKWIADIPFFGAVITHDKSKKKNQYSLLVNMSQTKVNGKAKTFEDCKNFIQETFETYVGYFLEEVDQHH